MTGTVIIDFGASGSNEAQVEVTGQDEIMSDSMVEAFVMADNYTDDHTASDHRYIEALGVKFTCGTPVEGSGFTVYGRSIYEIEGTFKINWVWA